MKIEAPEKAPAKKRGINADISVIYSSPQWKRLRQSKRQQTPLCEMCLSRGVFSPVTEIHHIRPISTGKSIDEMWSLALDSNNLMSLCERCHKEIHNSMNSNSDK